METDLREGKLCLKIDLVSHPSLVEELGRYIGILILYTWIGKSLFKKNSHKFELCALHLTNDYNLISISYNILISSN